MPTHGVLAYVAWSVGRVVCKVAPREVYPVPENSRVLKQVDEQAVWSVTLFLLFLARGGEPVLQRHCSTQRSNSPGSKAQQSSKDILQIHSREPWRTPSPDGFGFYLPQSWL